MLTRILSALVAAPPFLWCVYQGGWPLALLCAVLATLAQAELGGLAAAGPPGRGAYLAAFAVGLAGCWGVGPLFGVLCLGAVITALPVGLPPIDPRKVRAVLAALAGLGLYALPFGLFAWLRAGPEGRALAFTLLALVWIQDSGAYFTGMALGRTKLSPEVSPKKTWEGTVGGWLLGLGGAVYVLAQLGADLGSVGLGGPLVGGLVLAVAAAAAQLGDLFESGLKRAVGVKDSGALMPGHGGALDRFDGFAFAVLVVAGARLVLGG